MSPDSINHNGLDNPAARARWASIAAATWRELGFWYECRPSERRWVFRSDRAGLRRFAAILRRFLQAGGTDDAAGHLHLGPFANLRIGWAGNPRIDWRGFAGRREDLERLAREIEALASGSAGAAGELGAGFAHDDGFRAVVTIEPDGFDPASADTMFHEPGAT